MGSEKHIGKSTPDFFEDQVAKNPLAIALVYNHQSLTYQQLSYKANQLAHYLIHHGVLPETKVAICLERSAEMIIGILAIIKAGGAYVPMDPAYPQDRLRFMLKDTAAPILLTQKHLLGQFPSDHSARVVCLDGDWPEIATYPTVLPSLVIAPENLVYTIYTSGSTGRPKGVMVEHRNLINLVKGQKHFVRQPIERYLFAYSFAFDGAVLLIWSALLEGATLVMAKEGLEKDIHQLAAFIEQQKITHLLTFPSLYGLVLDQISAKHLIHLISISVAGEVCPPSLVKQHHRLLPKVRLFNQYGPTEATVGTSIYETHTPFSGEKVPIGRPIEGVQMYVLDEDLKPLPFGETGEIYIGGKGVTRGYLNLPELTEERFISDPFLPGADRRLYRTGDLGRQLPDGNFDFVGRADNQIKLRGFRIELGEIESALLNHKDIREAVVNLWGEKAEEQKLVGFLALKNGTHLPVATMRDFLSQTLPDYMIPAQFIFLEKLPLAASGKVDRKALSVGQHQRPPLEQAYVAPRNPLESYLAQRWSTILQIDPIGIHDKFFELGGNSLQAARFIGQLQQQIGETIFIVTIFDHPTVAEYAVMLQNDYAFGIEKLPGMSTPNSPNKNNANKNTALGETSLSDFEQYIPRLKPNQVVEKLPKNPPALFILAPPRSGTSLLRVMLAGHPKLFAANELQLLGFHDMQKRKAAYTGKFSLWSEGLIRVWMELRNCDADTAKKEIEDYTQQGYSTQQMYALLQGWIGDSMLVDKSPSYALDPGALQKAEQDFDGALYIHLVRHPYSMITSFERMRLDQVMYLHPHPYNARQLGELIWSKSHQNITEFLSKVPSQRHFRILYEDLVQEPEKVMRQLCERLELEYHPHLIQPYQALDQKMTDGIYTDSKPMGDVRLLEHGAIKANLADSWKGVLENDFLHPSTWQQATELGYESISKLIDTHPVKSTEKSKQEPVSAGIAIVGMSARFPGAKNLDEFWKNLVEEKDVSVEFAEEDLLAEGLDPAILNNPDYVRRGMPLEDADCFDASFFGYLPNEAALMDPQHRVYLECAYAALEDAGYDPERYPGLIGVFGGVARNTYLVNNVITHPNYFQSVDDFMLGITLEKDFPATRVAYKLNLKGPAVNVQTACSSSGVAIHLACQALVAGDADMMLVGGGRIQPPVRSGHLHKEGHALSPDGYCHTFGDQAQGMVRGHGMAFVVLKTYEQALADGDTIHAIIKATGISNDGSDKIGFTAPSIKGQAEAIIRAYQKAGINPETISYIEAHGTGTPIGDPIEIAGLTQAFRQFTNKKGFCGIGSVKTNIGHLDAGACLAGIIKTVLSIKNELLPASMHFHQANPQIDFANSPFFVNHSQKPWPRSEQVRRAGVSSLGLGGTNIHVVLEEAPMANSTSPAKSHELLILSAKTEKALEQATLNLTDYLAKHPDIAAADVAYTLQLGRKAWDYRRFVVHESTAQTIETLQQGQTIWTSKILAQKQELAFMFPGGGAQHRNMGRGLYDQQPVFKAAIDQCLLLLKQQHQLDLQDLLYPSDTEINEPIENPLHGITLLFAVEYATAQLWLSWGVKPKALIGHSLGEYTAACIAGVIQLEAAVAMVAKRGELFETLPQGGMLSIPLPEVEVKSLLNGHHKLSFAAINKPDHCVVSGAITAIDQAKQLLNSREIHSTRLHISVAAHSSEVEPILEEFKAFLETIAFAPPQIPLVSNVSGDWADPEQLQSVAYWCNHLRETVRFSDGIACLLKEPGMVLLETGPGQTLSTFARQHPAKQKNQKIFASLRHPKENTPDLAFLLKTAGQLWLEGIRLDWESFYVEQNRRRIPLPTYPFERKKHWITAKQFPGIPTVELELEKVLNMDQDYESTSIGDKASKVDRTQLLVEKLKGLFNQLSGIPTEEMNQQATFLEMGFDSLFLTQAVSKIKKEFKINLSFRQLFDEASSLVALAYLIDNQLPTEAFWEELEQLNAPQQAAPSAVNTMPPRPALAEPTVPSHSPSPTTPAAPIEGLESIVQRQLQIMEQQLALLQGGAGKTQMPKPVPAVQAAKPEPKDNSSALTRPAVKVVEDKHKAFGPWIPPKKKIDQQFSEREQQYLKELIEKYTTKTKGSQRLTDSQRLRMADPRSITGFNKLWKDMIYQIAVERSKGAYFWDVDGNKYIDYLMSFGISLMGHTPDFVQEAIRQQLEKGIELGGLTPLAKEVCDLLCELSGMERATLVNTGSEAVSAAVRAARTVTFKDKIAVFEGDYHGIADELLVRSVKRDGDPISMPVAPGIPSSLVSQVIVLDYDDPNVLEVIRQNADELAAVIIEPIQPNNPHRQPRELIHAIRRITAENDIALIFDEMITGFRLGMRGAQEWYDVEVDLVAYGKIISGGLPMAAVAGKARFLDPFDGGMWQFGDDSIPTAGVTFFGGTFVKNPLALAASLATLQEIKKQGETMYQELNAKSARYAERLRELFIRTKVPLQVLATASLVAIKTTDSNPLSKLFFYYMVHKGVHLLDKAALISTAHSEEDLDFTFRMVEETIREMQTAGFFQITVADPKDESIIVYPPTLTARATEKKKIALTEGQKEVWVEHRLGREAAAAYNLAGELPLVGPFRIDYLRQAAQQLVDRHQSLRSHFDRDNLSQTILPNWSIEVPLTDLSHLSAEEAQVQLNALRAAEVEQAFDLFAGPLFRLQVVRLAEQDHRLLMTAHHGIADGWSCGILAQELGALYSAAWEGRKANLAPAKSIEAFVAEQEDYVQSKAFAETEAYWLSRFADGVPVLDLPTDRSRPLVKTYAASQEAIPIDKELMKALQELAASQGTTFFILMYTAFQVLIHRLSGQDDFVLGLTAAAQSIAGNQNLVAHGVNLLPVRNQLQREATFAATLKESRNVLLDALEHQNYSLGSLVKKLKLKRDPSRQPVISILFNMDSDSGNIAFGPSNVRIQPIPRNYETFDSFINLKPTAQGASMEWIYNTDLFDAVTIRWRLAEFRQLLESIVHHPQQSIWALPLLPETEKTLLQKWNTTQADFPKNTPIHEFFEAEVQRCPERLAAICNGQQMTYKTLNAKANQMAHLLISEGAQVGDYIGIYFERSLDMLVALLATLKIGGIYVPLDPVNPTERIQLLLEDVEARILLTHDALKNRLPDFDGLVLIQEEISLRLSKQADRNIAGRVKSTNLAYVIYTSGSTGKPKSVAIPHFAVVDHHLAMKTAIGFTESDTVLSVASVAFDPSVQDFFLPLFIGAKVAIATKEETLDGFLLKELIERVDATIMQATPASWRMLLMSGWKGKTDLTMLCGGEGLTGDFAHKLLARGKTVYNIYGPTETTIWSTFKKVEKDRLKWTTDSGYVSVGRPLNNVQIYILDHHLQEVPIGVAGEVYIGGVGVAPGGYLKRPELTAERFVNHPLKGHSGEKLYRTGDLGRYLNNGDLEYLSRVDNQVKIRGYRIELGEIESNVAQFPGVRENIVLVREDRPDDKRLVAYLIMETGQALDTKALQDFLKKRLPAYMIPTAFVVLDAFPLTTTMKVDRKLLPLPDWNKRVAEEAFLAPQNETERMLASIWSELLGVQKISRNDNFFELGGHSLIAVNMMAKLEAASGKKLPLSSLLENATIEDLSRLLTTQEVCSSKNGSLVPIKTSGNKLPIYLVHGAGLHVLMFQTLAAHMDPDQPIYALQARGLNGEAKPLDKLEDIAAHYIAEILEQNPQGPYALAGYSFGGLIAFEMAKQLKQMGREVVMLGMFDTVVRQSIRGEKESYYKQLMNLGKKMAWNFSLLAKNPLESLKYKSNTLQVRFRRWTSGKKYDAREEIRGDQSANAVFVDQQNQKAFESYKITPYDGEIHLFRASNRQFWVDDFDFLGWKPYAREGVVIHEVSGDHLHLFNPPHGARFAKILQETLDNVLVNKGQL